MEPQDNRSARFVEVKVLVIIGIGFVAGILSGLLGIGGGVIMVPAMVYLLGLRQHMAHGTSLAAISVIVFVSAMLYSKHGHLNWVVAAEMAVGGVLGAYVGARLCTKISGPRLRRFFASFLVAVSIKMLYDAHVLMTGTDGLVEGGMVIAGTTFGGAMVILLIGVLTGIFSGIMGVGGGVLMIPAMVLLLGFPQTLAQGVSLAVIIPTSISGALIHSGHGNVRVGIAIWLALGGLLGGWLGANLAVGQAEWVLKGCFGVLTLVMGLLMFRPRPQRVTT